MNSRKNASISIGIILIVQLVVTFEMNVVLPLAPIIAQLYEVPAHQVTYMNVGFAVFGMLAPIIGYNADKYGLKNMIVVTLFVFVVGSLLIANVPSLVAYVVGRSLMGMSFFTMLGIGLSYLSLLVSKERLGVVSGLHRIAFALGVLISPHLGTIIVRHISFFMIYNILAVLMIGLIVIFIIATPQLESHQEKINPLALRVILNGRNERKMMLATFLLSLPAVFFFNYLSVYLASIGKDANTIASIYSIIAIGSTSGGLTILFLSDRFGKTSMLIKASTLIPVALLLFYAFLSNLWIALLFGFLFGLLFDTSTGLLFPVASLQITTFTSTFLTVLSLTMSFTSVISNIVGPTLYDLGGFFLLIVIIASGVFIASFLLKTTMQKKVA